MTYSRNSRKRPHCIPSAGSNSCTPSTDPDSPVTTCQFHSLQYDSHGETLSRLLQFLLVVRILHLIPSPSPHILLQQARDGGNCVHLLLLLFLTSHSLPYLLLARLLLSLAHVKPLAQYRQLPPSSNHPPTSHPLVLRLLLQHFVAVPQHHHLLRQTLLVRLQPLQLQLGLQFAGRFLGRFAR